MAGFHMSRLLLDANRATAEEQIPLEPYVGSAELYAEYLNRRADELREEALLPWLDAVDAVLRQMGKDGVAYHHHTYDMVSMSPRPFDRGSTPERPPFQLVWTRPRWNELYDGLLSDDDGLAPMEHIQQVRDRISAYLHTKMNLSEGNGAIDYPMFLPVVPFTGTHKEDPQVPPGM